VYFLLYLLGELVDNLLLQMNAVNSLSAFPQIQRKDLPKTSVGNDAYLRAVIEYSSANDMCQLGYIIG